MAYRERLEARFRPGLGSRLEMLPPEFDPARLASRYGAMDIFCYPSLAVQGEGLSVAPLEAMAAAAVPVLSNLGCYDDIVTNGVNGFRFDHTASPQLVAAQLTDILAGLISDAARRRTMAQAAQQTARRFDYTALGQTLLARLASL